MIPQVEASPDIWAAWDMIEHNPDKMLNDPELLAWVIQTLLYVIDRHNRVRPLIPNATQMMIIRAYCEMRRAGLPVRMIILKGRQQGSSTIVCAIILVELLCFNNRMGLVATEEKGGSAANMFDKYKFFIEHMPVFDEGTMLRDICSYYNDGHRVTFKDTRSTLRTEGEKEIISFTTNSVHISEAAFFTDFAKFMGPLMQGVPHFPNTSVFIESTAREYGDGFHDHWNRAESGLSNFRAVFAGWHIHEENVMGLPTDPDELDRFHVSVGQMIDAYGDELALKQAHNLTNEQLMFRRWRIDNDCDGSVEEFNRQYPATPRDAFLAAERPVFDSASLEIRLDSCKPSAYRGEMRPQARFLKHDGTERAEWIDTPNGCVELWQKPITFEEYVIGSDHAEGIQGGDFNACTIFLRDGFEQTGKIHGSEATKLEAIDYAKQLYYVARWHNNAWILLESNHQSGGAVAAILQEWNYPNLMFEHQIFPKDTGEQPMNPRVGWLSNKDKRKVGVDFAVSSLSYDFRTDPPRAKSEWNPIVYDREMIEQCVHMTIVDGKPQAKNKGKSRRPGSSSLGHHDDLVFAFISTLFAHKALPSPEPKEARMIEELGPDHPEVRQLPEAVLEAYASEPEDNNPYTWQRYM